MGIHDRDWYQEWWAKKEGITKSEPREPEPRFRPITPPSPWARVLLKTTVDPHPERAHGARCRDTRSVARWRVSCVILNTGQVMVFWSLGAKVHL